MGLAASQTRLVTLTARRADLEMQGQSINQQRLTIAAQEETLADNYSKALSATKLQINATSNTGDSLELSLTPTNLANYANTVIVDTTTGKTISANTAEDAIAQGLKDGKYQTYTIGSGSYDTTGNFQGTLGTEYNWNGTLPDGSETQIQSVSDTDGEQTAELTYEAALAQIEPQDKMLEMNLKDIDTQHQAIQTEIDAVKKVIDKDIDSSFKTFNGNG